MTKATNGNSLICSTEPRSAAAQLVRPEPTEFERAAATALYGVEQALAMLYTQFAGGRDQPEDIKLTTGIEMCRNANAQIQALFGVEKRPPATKKELGALRWPERSGGK